MRGAGRSGTPTWERGAKYKPRGRGTGPRNWNLYFEDVKSQYFILTFV